MRPPQKVRPFSFLNYYNGDIGTAVEDEQHGWTPTDMTHHGDMWHIAGTTLFDENAHWGGPADDEPGGDERH